MSEDPQWPRADAWLGGNRDVPESGRLLAVLGLPLSQASISPSRADLTPPAVRRALRRFSTFLAHDDGTGVDLEAVHAVDLGDVDVSGIANAEAQDLIAAAVAELQNSVMLPRRPDLFVLLGGDNAVTRPAMASVVNDLTSSGLLTLDAHHDVRGWHDGPTNGTPVRGLIEDGLPGANIVQIGIGGFTNSRAYRSYCDDAGIKTMTVGAARAEGVGAAVTARLDELAARCAQIYVDLDVDVLDSAFAPGCPGARPGGLTPAELHAAAFAAGRHPAVVAIDIVEVDAGEDPAGITTDNAALCLLHAAAGLALRP